MKFPFTDKFSDRISYIFRRIFLCVFPVLLTVCFALTLMHMANIFVSRQTIALETILWAVMFFIVVTVCLAYGQLRKNRWVFFTETALVVLMISGFVWYRELSASDTLADICGIVCPMLAILVYIIHFFTKEVRSWILDIIKIVFVIASMALFQEVFIRSVYERVVSMVWMVSSILLSVALLFKLYRSDKKRGYEGIAQDGNDIFLR